jgi:hypothetical protein
MCHPQSLLEAGFLVLSGFFSFLLKKFHNINVTLEQTAHFKNVNNSLNTNIYSNLKTSGGQSSNLYLYVVHFFNASVN